MQNERISYFVIGFCLISFGSKKNVETKRSVLPGVGDGEGIWLYRGTKGKCWRVENILYHHCGGYNSILCQTHQNVYLKISEFYCM